MEGPSWPGGNNSLLDIFLPSQQQQQLAYVHSKDLSDPNSHAFPPPSKSENKTFIVYGSLFACLRRGFIVLRSTTLGT